MPRNIEFKKDLPEILQREAYKNAMYFYVIGQKDVVPSAQIKDCIQRFMDKYDIKEETWGLDIALQTFYKFGEFDLKLSE